MPLADVSALSDDEEDAGHLGGMVVDQEKCRSIPCRKRRLHEDPESMVRLMGEIRRELTRVIHKTSCRCAKKRRGLRAPTCFVAFRQPQRFDEVVKLRKTLRTMHKVDADQLVPRPNLCVARCHRGLQHLSEAPLFNAM